MREKNILARIFRLERIVKITLIPSINYNSTLYFNPVYLFPKRRDTFGYPEEPKDDELDEILLDPKSGDALGRLELLRERLKNVWF